MSVNPAHKMNLFHEQNMEQTKDGGTEHSTNEMIKIDQRFLSVSLNVELTIILYCKCVYYWSRHIKEDNILLSNFVMVGEKIGFQKENDKSFIH